MFLQVVVSDDVVIDHGVSFWSEVPRFFLWVVWSLFKSSQFVFEVDNVVSLFISESVVLVLSKRIDEVILFIFPRVSFNICVVILLGDWVVNSFSCLDFFLGDQLLGIWFALELFFLLDVGLYIFFPARVIFTFGEEDFIAGSHCNLLIFCSKESHI